jgi:ribose/xylose/arabinose/galactoside ABC-type transport system permease subunit
VSQLRSLIRQRFFVVLVLLAVMITVFAITQERFFTIDNLSALLNSSSILWVTSMGLTFVMLAGGFDLSVGSTLALTSIALGWFMNDAGMSVGLAIPLTVLLGTLLGAVVNGIPIGRFQLSFLVVTLGSLTLFKGVTLGWSQSKTTQINSKFLDDLAYGKQWVIPNQVIVMILVYLVMLYVQKFTFFGRDIYAIGGNADAARLSGIRTSGTLITVYAICAGLAGLAGVIQDARIGAASPQVGENLVFQATAAVLLGGTSFSGGIGGVSGTVVGVLFLATLQNGLSVAGFPNFWQQIITGGILIGAIALDYVQRKRNNQSRRKKD